MGRGAEHLRPAAIFLEENSPIRSNELGPLLSRGPLMHADRGQIMLTGQNKGHGTVADQCQTFAIRPMKGIDRLNRPNLFPQIIGQIGHRHGPDIDDLALPTG